MRVAEGEGTPHGVAQRIAACETEILDRYREGLELKHNPLASHGAAWAGCRLQAQRILALCVESLAAETADLPGSQLSSVLDLAADRVQQGMRISDSAEAGMVLCQVVMDVLVRELSAEPDAVRLLDRAIRALQLGIGVRLQYGAAAYDAFLLSTVTEVNRRGYLTLARDIHDQLGNSLSLALRQLDLFEMTAGGLDPAAEVRLAAVRSAVKDSLLTARDVVGGLRRNARQATLLTALNTFIDSMDLPDIDAQVYVNGSENWAPAEALDELYVVIRECLRNAFAHAKAEKIVVRVDIAPHEIHALVVDDGRGFDQSEVRGRKSVNGLTGMRERIALLDGVVAISAAPGKGTTVKVWIPIREEAAGHGE